MTILKPLKDDQLSILPSQLFAAFLHHSIQILMVQEQICGREFAALEQSDIIIYFLIPYPSIF